MTRIHGLDLARALAIIGMMAAHLGPDSLLTDGHPSVLFAVLAGVSMGIIASRAPLVDARVNLLVRGILLVGMGVVLEAVQAGIIVVLIAIGASYLLLSPVIRWSTPRLAGLLAALFVVGPLLQGAHAAWPVEWAAEGFADLVFGVYPLLAWLAYTLIGLLIHRLVLGEPWLQASMLALGMVLVGGTQLSAGVLGVETGPYEVPSFGGAALQAEAHTGGLLDMTGSIGVALMVIAACLLLCRVPAVVWATYPLRAFGSMSFTVYVVHVVVTTILNGTFVSLSSTSGGETRPDAPGESDYGWGLYPPGESAWMPDLPKGDISEFPLWPEAFLWQLAFFLVFASLWKWKLRRGPIEWGVHRAVRGTVGEHSRE